MRAWLQFGGAVGHCDHYRAVSWIGGLRRAGAAQATLNHRLAALRAFYRYAAAAGLAPLDAAGAVPRSHHVPERLPYTLDDADVGRLLAAPDLSTFRGFRDAVMLRVLYETGLRSGELASLTVGDVLPDRMIYVAGGARRRDRYVPIAERTWLLLDDYQRLRAGKRVGKSSALWVDERGRALRGARSVWALVNRYARQALGRGSGCRGLRRAGAAPWTGVYPELLRNSYAAAMLAHGAPLTVVAQLLGHADVATTARHLGVALEPLRAAIQRNPRGVRSV